MIAAGRLGRGTLRGDLLNTLVSGVGVFIGVLVLYGLIARLMGTEALGEFLLVRRTAFTLMGVFLIGMNLGLPYYVAKAGDHAYGLSALLIFALLTVPLIGLASRAISVGVLAGFPTYLALPFFVFTTAYAVQYLAFALLRGRLNIWGANLVQLLGTGLIPIAVFLLLRERSVPLLLRTIGIATIGMSALIYLLNVDWRGRVLELRKAWDLLSYGGSRMVGFAAEFILLGGAPLLILGGSTKSEVAYLNSGISLLRLFLLAVGPLGIVLLPRISRAMDRGNTARLAVGLEVLAKSVLLTGLPLALLLSMNSATILRVWLGAGNEAGVEIVRLIVLALPFYLLIMVLRAPIDAASQRGYNSVVYGAAALILLALFFGLRAVSVPILEAGVLSFVGAHVAGAAGSLYFARKLYGITLFNPWYVLTLLAVLAVSLVLLYSIRAVVPGPASLAVGAVALGAILSLYFARSRSDWVAGLRSLLVGK
ncbi:MAG: hypothetical protein V3U35_07795 [Candidatus Neomarinimicrobiota bacterium]